MAEHLTANQHPLSETYPQAARRLAAGLALPGSARTQPLAILRQLRTAGQEIAVQGFHVRDLLPPELLAVARPLLYPGDPRCLARTGLPLWGAVEVGR